MAILNNVQGCPVHHEQQMPFPASIVTRKKGFFNWPWETLYYCTGTYNPETAVIFKSVGKVPTFHLFFILFPHQHLSTCACHADHVMILWRKSAFFNIILFTCICTHYLMKTKGFNSSGILNGKQNIQARQVHIVPCLDSYFINQHYLRRPVDIFSTRGKPSFLNIKMSCCSCSGL